MRYIDSLKLFRSKYKFTPKRGLIQEYLRIANKTDNDMLYVIAMCHAMRLGYDINN